MSVSESIASCRICDSKDIEPFLDLGNQPPANSLRKDLDEVLPLVPLTLVFCHNCSTIQLSDTIKPDYLFRHYVWVTGTSATAQKYSETFCARALTRLKAQRTQPFVVEVASNDGTFLQRFKTAGCRVQGIDPALNIAEIAIKRGIPTDTSFFDVKVAERLRREQGEANLVIARNVIPHVKEVHSIVEGMAHLIGSQGVGIIEFHYAGTILDELHYDSVYHEHLFYFTLKTLGHLLARHGVRIFDIERSPISGGSLVVYFSKQEAPRSQVLDEIERSEEASGLNSIATWRRFAERCHEHSEKLTELILEAKKLGSVVGFGASARSSTLLNFCKLNNSFIDYIFDNNELKQGLYTPGSNIKIVAFENGAKPLDKAAAVVVLAWNFGDEIEAALRRSGYKGPIIVPLPNDPQVKK